MEGFFPSKYEDSFAMEREQAEVMAEFAELMQRLSPQDRQVAKRYLAMVKERENWIKRTAYLSGVQVGRREAERAL